MKRMRFFVLPLLLTGFSALAYADGVPVDPQMDVSDPLCSSPSGSGCPTNVNESQGFTFTVGPNGGGIFMGTNEDTQWNSLLFTFVPPPGGVGPISCTSGAAGGAPFFPCSQSTETNGTVDLFYNNFCEGTCPGGITPNDIFTITLNDVGLPTGSWPVGLTFLAYPNQSPGHEVTPSGGFVTLTAVPVPEPATLTLLGVGIGALAAKRRFRRQRDSRS